MTDKMLEMFRDGLREAKKQRKSDDILDFIKANWKLFTATRNQMQTLCEELEQRGDLSVTALAEALGLPDTVLFKKVKVVDTAKLVLNFRKSELVSLFNKLIETKTKPGHKAPELCVFAVAGNHTMLVTNMRTKRVPGKVELFLTAEEGNNDIHVFPFVDAPERLPVLFGNKES